MESRLKRFLPHLWVILLAVGFSFGLGMMTDHCSDRSRPAAAMFPHVPRIPELFNLPTVSAQTSAPIGPYGNLGFTNTTIAATQTVPAVQMVGLITATTAAATTLTTDTATNICALFPFVAINTPGGGANFAFDMYVKATGANTATVAAGAGVTLVGTGTAATVTVRHFKVQLVNCSGTAAVNLFSLETAAF